jgi:hypothetical protein
VCEFVLFILIHAALIIIIICSLLFSFRVCFLFVCLYNSLPPFMRGGLVIMHIITRKYKCNERDCVGVYSLLVL